MGNSESKPESIYVLHRSLTGHTARINALRFSPDCKLLASAASDNKLKIWSTRTGSCLQTISNTANGPVTDVIWASNRKQEQGLIFSCADGSVHTYIHSFEDSSFRSAIITSAHTSAIECIDFDSENKRIATVGSGEVKVWIMNPDWSLDLHASEPRHETVTSRTVHFFNQGQSVLATYLETSKIVAWNVDPWNKLWERKTENRIGHCALSPDGQHVLIHNLRDGAERYIVPNMTREAAYLSPVAVKCPKQVAFNPTGDLVIQGSDKGLVYLSDFDNTVTVQSLYHSSVRDAMVPAVTSHSHRDQHWIASGCATETPTVKIWKRKRVGQEDALYGAVFLCIGLLVYFSGLWAQAITLKSRVLDRVWR